MDGEFSDSGIPFADERKRLKNRKIKIPDRA